MKLKKKNILGAILLFASMLSFAQEVVNEFQLRNSVEIEYEAFKDFTLSFSPELRLGQDFSIDNYHFQLEADYKLSKIFSLGARYRFVVNPRENNDTEYQSLYGVNLKLKKKFNRFKTAVRFSYTNDADEDYNEGRSNFLRYKATAKYNIKSCKLEPMIGLEAFQQLQGEGLYKMRYLAGLGYKFNKKNQLGLTYKFDYYRIAYVNKHIVELTYKFKF